MRGKVQHTHQCDRCRKASVWCQAIPVRDEGGAYCPGEAHPESFVCEDCRDLDSCAYCGLWSEALNLKQWESDLFCERCYQVVVREESTCE